MDKNVKDTIQAFLRGYSRRASVAGEQLKKQNKKQSETLRELMAWNDRIDRALTILDEPLRVGMFHDIKKGTGYMRSPLKELLTINRYNAMKQKTLESLAKELHLIAD